MAEIWNVAGAVLIALGGGGAIVLSMSSWLGRIWAERIMQNEKAKYQAEFAILKSEIDKKIHEHNVAVTRVDAQRVDAIKQLYDALIGWHEACMQILAPNKLHEQSVAQAIETYRIWSGVLREQSESLEKITMSTAIYLSEETYALVARCGYSASTMSYDFVAATYEFLTADANGHIRHIDQARKKLRSEYEAIFKPARMAVINEFRGIIDPRIRTNFQS